MNTQRSGSNYPQVTPRSTATSRESTPGLATARIGHRSGRVLDLIREDIEASRARAAERLLTKPAPHTVIAKPSLRDLVIVPKKPPVKEPTSNAPAVDSYVEPSPVEQPSIQKEPLLTRMSRTATYYRTTIAAVSVAAAIAVGGLASWFFSKGENETKRSGGALGKDSGAEVVKAKKAEASPLPTPPAPKTVATPTPEVKANPKATESKKTQASPQPEVTVQGEKTPNQVTSSATPSKPSTTTVQSAPTTPSPDTAKTPSQTTKHGVNQGTTNTAKTTPPAATPKDTPAPSKAAAEKKPKQGAITKAPAAQEDVTVAKALPITNNEEMLKSLGKMITSYMRGGETLAAQRAKRDSMSKKAWDELVWDEAKASAAQEGVNLSGIVLERNTLRSSLAPQKSPSSSQNAQEIAKQGSIPASSQARTTAAPQADGPSIDDLVPPGGKLHLTTTGKPYQTGFQRSVITDEHGQEIARVTRTKLLGLTIWKSTTPLNGVDRATALEVVSVLDTARRAAVGSK